jgi:hypothetical protein
MLSDILYINIDVIYIYIIYKLYIYLSSGNRSLEEVVLHELLEVEVGKLIRLGELEKLGKLGVSMDLATILGILKLIGADVGIDLLGDSGSGKKRTLVLSEEKSKLIRDKGWLNKSGRGTVSRSTLFLLRSLLCSLKLLGNNLLKCLELSLEGGCKRSKLVDLLRILGKADADIGFNDLTINRGDDHFNCRGRSDLLGLLRSLRGLIGNGGLIGGSLNSSNHLVIIYYYIESFLSILTHIYIYFQLRNELKINVEIPKDYRIDLLRLYFSKVFGILSFFTLFTFFFFSI